MLRIGAQPPFVVPYCSLCELPVERFAPLPVRSMFYIELEAHCCGRTQGVRVSIDELLRVKRTNAKLYVIVKKGRYQGVGELRRGA